VTVTTGNMAHHREVEGAWAIREIRAEAEKLNALAEGAAWGLRSGNKGTADDPGG
jgi:hypothetical protein